MKKELPQVVWVARDYSVQGLIDQYHEREIDYLALVSAFRKNGWCTAGLNEVVRYQEEERKFNDWIYRKPKGSIE